jgi:hypothetical protein
LIRCSSHAHNWQPIPHNLQISWVLQDVDKLPPDDLRYILQSSLMNPKTSNSTSISSRLHLGAGIWTLITLRLMICLICLSHGFSHFLHQAVDTGQHQHEKQKSEAPPVLVIVAFRKFRSPSMINLKFVAVTMGFDKIHSNQHWILQNWNCEDFGILLQQIPIPTTNTVRRLSSNSCFSTPQQHCMVGLSISSNTVVILPLFNDRDHGRLFTLTASRMKMYERRFDWPHIKSCFSKEIKSFQLWTWDCRKDVRTICGPGFQQQQIITSFSSFPIAKVWSPLLTVSPWTFVHIVEWWGELWGAPCPWGPRPHTINPTVFCIDDHLLVFQSSSRGICRTFWSLKCRQTEWDKTKDRNVLPNPHASRGF